MAERNLRPNSIFQQPVRTQISQGRSKIVLDVKDVAMIDSSGLGALVAAYSTAKRSGASLRLCNLGARFSELLQITKLLTVFDVSNSQADAAHSFGSTVS